MKQVISVSPTGDLTGLQHKPGQGVDLIALSADGGGKADVVRASEVLWNKDAQKWTVQFKEGAGSYAGRYLDIELVMECMNFRLSTLDEPWVGSCPLSSWPSRIFLFPDYDSAIKAEIAVLNALRLGGKL
jgi:hypothetical protein